MKQHYMFLIDRANSVQKERLFQTKSAVYKALEELGPEDTFNITVFDSKMEKLFPAQRPLNRSSLAAAKEFIHKIDLGSFFSPADLYKPLLITVPSYVQEDEVYTAILLTDGDALAKKNAGLTLLREWSRYNQGKVALYTLGMSGDKHISSLEAICAFNRGQAIQSSTKRGLKRKLLRLMKTIQAPIVKNISCHAFSRSPHTTIKIYPDNTRTHHLYAGQPYTMIGTAETLDDFVLFVQGRIKDRWLNIKKTVSFISAKKGDSSLEAQWAWQKAYDLYGQYLQDKNSEHLAEMQRLINPLQLPPAFQ
jgi:Ca-activated chloride channel family protein